MTTKPMTTDQYNIYLRGRVDSLESALSAFAGIDERVDYTNKLLLRLLDVFGAAPDGAATWQKQIVESASSLSNIVGRLQLEVHDIQKLTLENPQLISTKRVLTKVANTAIKFPYHLVPFGRELVVKSLGSNTQLIYIGNSQVETEDPTLAYQMDPGEVIELKIRDTGQLWLSTIVAGEGVAFIVEQEAVNG